VAEIRFEPDLEACVETLAKGEYEAALRKILEADEPDDEVATRIAVLSEFLESADFGALRGAYEPHLARGGRVVVTVASTDTGIEWRVVLDGAPPDRRPVSD
jgi:hypothetical protein